MTDRFSTFHLYTASFRQIKKRSINASMDSPDWTARSVVVLLPLAAAIVTFIIGPKLGGVELLISAVGILSGAFLASFGQLASWRSNLPKTGTSSSSLSCRRIDEAAAHSLAGTAAGILLVGLLVVRIAWQPLPKNVSPVLFLPANYVEIISEGLNGLVSRCLSGSIAALGFYILVLLLMSVSLFWTAYEDINDVPKRSIKRSL